MTRTEALAAALEQVGEESAFYGLTQHEFAAAILAALDGWTLVPTPAPAEGPDPCPHCDMEHVWPCPTIPRCDEPGCEKATSCGFPTDTGYRRTCGDHYRAAEAER